MHLTESMEDYLEAIAELTAVDGHAHVKEIAEKLQYKDLSDFSRQYKKYRGFSPGKTRNSHNGYEQEKNLISRQITQ